jgi:uncharacterized DUF497 family protein
MNFEWDEVKNRSNIRKHGLDFADWKTCFGACFSWNRIREKITGKTLERNRHNSRAHDCGHFCRTLPRESSRYFLEKGTS